MKLAFAGTPEFAAIILDTLIASEHEVDAVLTRPDARAGRGRRMTQSPVKRRAAAAGIETRQPRTLRGRGADDVRTALDVDALVVAAYGLLLPASILATPRLGCINVHASLLPRWRGAAPTAHAILAGDRETGVSIMQMDEGLDTGPVLSSRTCAVADDDTAGSLSGRLAALGAAALVDTLDGLERGAVAPEPQDEARATTAPKLSKVQAAIDWSRPAVEIERSIRAFDPWPVAHAYFHGDGKPACRIWRANVVSEDAVRHPGTVLQCDASGLVVATSHDALRIGEIQPAGARRMTAADFARGHRIEPGTRLGRGPQ